MPRLRHLSGAIAAVLALSSAVHAQSAQDFNKMVVIGDSLSDDGNISLALGQPRSRFTTNPGQVAAENIADSLGFMLTPSVTGGNDYAFGGAGVDNNSDPGPIPLLGQQYDMYLQANGGHADSRTLYSVWGGANDIFYATSGAVPLADIQSTIATAAQDEVALIGHMHDTGARYALVFNLPDIGQTPSGIASGAASSLTTLSLVYNGVLNTGLQKYSEQGLNVIPVDTFSLLNEVIKDPHAFGFTNVTDPACGVGSSSLACGPAGSGASYTYPDGANETYLFADGVHPTTAAHRFLAQYVVAEIEAPGQTSLLAEAPIAASATHMRTVRSNMLDTTHSTENRLFANASYGRQRFDATGNSPRTESSNVNLTVGTAAHAGAHVSVGAALGVSHDRADVSGNAGGYRLNALQGTGFALYHAGGGYVGGYLGFAQLDYDDIQRRFHLGALQRTEAGRTNGSQLLGGAMGGWMFHPGKSVHTGPFARIEWQRIRVDGFTEFSGDSSSMWFGSQTRFALTDTLGWRLRGDWTIHELVLHPYAELAWNHDSRADARKVRAGLSDGLNGSFALTGFVPDSNWASVDLGIMTEFSPSTTGWIGYKGHFADSNQKLNSFNMGLKISF